MGSREDVAARIEADTKIKIDEMNKAVTAHKEAVSEAKLSLFHVISLSRECRYDENRNKRG